MGGSTTPSPGRGSPAWPELRIDPCSGERAIIAPGRAVGPGAALSVASAPAVDPGDDPFAEGNEDRTPPELYAVRAGGGAADSPAWSVRVLPSPDPVLSEVEDGVQRGGLDGPPARPGANPNRDLFWSAPASGAHEVIVNSPKPVASLSQLTADEVGAAVEVWRERMRFHAEAASVQVIVDERAQAGASLPHTHAQLYALPFVPAAVARERERFAAYATRTMGGNLLADLVQEEVRGRERIVAIDDDIVLMAPYASCVPYQLMLAPRRLRRRFEDPGPTGAPMLHAALQRLARRFGACPPLHLWVHTAPRGAEQFCWRIDVLPRLLPSAGLERATGLRVNVVPPERAAAELREV